jgi:inosine triphosphate pyrophosphatase
MASTLRHTIVFVTGNANKLKEVQAILPSTHFELIPHKLDLPELQGPSSGSIAMEKCRLAYKSLVNQYPSSTAILTEDTCLCFKSMKGLPGPYIKWFLNDLGHEGLNTMLDGFRAKDPKHGDDAFALCTFTMMRSEEEGSLVFEGITEGKIVAARGPNTFG